MPPPDDGGPRDVNAGTPKTDGPPDLAVHADRARSDFAVRKQTFTEMSCELHPDEMCVDAPGERTLLAFSVETPNLGEGDMILGSPVIDNGNFTYSACHNHFHFNGYAEYRLFDAEGDVVRTGRKQAFCLTDSVKIRDDARPIGRYNCQFQGIQAGWSDVYASDIACQHLDVTGIEPGPYQLEISVNAQEVLMESDYSNNVVKIPLTLGDPNLDTPTEPCPLDLDDRSKKNDNRECGWQLDGEYACTPGQKVRVGCAQSCGIGSCSGDPMLRVCDTAGEPNCWFGAAIGKGNNQCASTCPLSEPFTCPSSGKLRVYVASSRPEAAFSCNVTVSPPPAAAAELDTRSSL